MTRPVPVTTDHASLTDRIRATLAAERSTREVTMFGGLSFMVNDKMVVAMRSDGTMLVRVDPERNRELVALPGAGLAEMGAGRAMGRSWISVAEEAIATDERLSFWVGTALEYTDRAGRPAP